MTFTKKLNKLIQIYNIPLEEDNSNFFEKGAGNPYEYWNVLELINDNELKNALGGEKVIESNPIILRFFKNIDYYWRPSIYKGKMVADVGSGWGFLTFWLLLSGADKILAVGDPIRTRHIKKLYQEASNRGLLPEDSIIFKGELIKPGDTHLSKEVEANSLSMVLLHDTLEHITPRIFPHFVRALKYHLKSGGLFISKQVNTDNPKMRTRLKMGWENYEKNIGIPDRINRIKKILPEINKEDAVLLSKESRGLDSFAFIEAVERFKDSGEFPTGNTELPAIDIEWDNPIEGDTSIKRILSEFRKNDFKIHVYPAMMHTRRLRIFQPIGRLFPTILLNQKIVGGTTVFVAEKNRE